MPTRKVVDLLDYRRAHPVSLKAAIRLCRHCRAVLADGESEDECSSAVFAAEAMPAPRRRAVSDVV